MPKMNVFYPIGLFDSSVKWDNFLNELADVTASAMEAINPATGERVVFEPYRHIDILSFPYDPSTSHPTAVVLIEIITYGWPDRMENSTERLTGIAEYVGARVPEEVDPGWKDAVSVTFLAKGEGCWVAN